MTFYSIAIWQIVLATAAYFAIGALWYSPALFGKQWQKLLGKKNMGKMAPAMIRSAISMLVAVMVLAYFAHSTGAAGSVTRSAYLGVKLWLVAAAVVQIHDAYEGRPFALYAINMGYALAGFMAAGAIIGLS